MVRRHENLVDSDTRVDVHTGIVAAGRPQSLIDSRECGRELLVKVRWTRSVTRSSSHCRRNVGGDEPFDPTEFIDEDDKF